MSDQKPQFRRPTVPASPDHDRDDPMWWLARELEAAQAKQRARVGNKYGMGQWEALGEMQDERAAAGFPIDEGVAFDHW